MKKFLIVILAIFAIGITSCDSGIKPASKEELKGAISKLSAIYTVEAIAEVTIESTDDNSSFNFKSFFGNRTIIIPIRANLKAGFDLSKITDLKIEGNSVSVTLPEVLIEIESTKILHDKIISDVSGFRSDFSGQEEAEISQLGRKKIEDNLSKFGLKEPAQEQAKVILTGIIKKLGYTNVFFN